jgi:hypothetical protein
MTQTLGPLRMLTRSSKLMTKAYSFRARSSSTNSQTPCTAPCKNTADIKANLDEAAAEVDRATDGYKRGYCS